MSRKSKAQRYVDEMQKMVSDIIYGQPDAPAPNPDDLVARLRLISAWKTPGGPMPTEDMVNPHMTCTEAADRIEQLEAALEKIGAVASQYSIRSGLAYKMINIAHTALKGNNGGQDRIPD